VIVRAVDRHHHVTGDDAGGCRRTAGLRRRNRPRPALLHLHSQERAIPDVHFAEL